jgi:hypothetical protein
VAGTARLSILAVSALMTNSNLLDCTTGRSAGLAPLRMCPPPYDFPGFRPSEKMPWLKAAKAAAISYSWADAPFRIPTTGIAACCARASSGHAAVAPWARTVSGHAAAAPHIRTQLRGQLRRRGPASTLRRLNQNGSSPGSAGEAAKV